MSQARATRGAKTRPLTGSEATRTACTEVEEDREGPPPGWSAQNENSDPSGKDSLNSSDF